MDLARGTTATEGLRFIRGSGVSGKGGLVSLVWRTRATDDDVDGGNSNAVSVVRVAGEDAARTHACKSLPPVKNSPDSHRMDAQLRVALSTIISAPFPAPDCAAGLACVR